MKVNYSQVFDMQPLRKTYFLDLLALAAVPMMEHRTGTACVQGAWGTQPEQCRDRIWLPITMSGAQRQNLKELESQLPTLAAPVKQEDARRFYSVFFQINEGPPWVPRLVDELSAMAQRQLRANNIKAYRAQLDAAFPGSKASAFCSLLERDALIKAFDLFDRISELAENGEHIDSPADPNQPMKQGNAEASQQANAGFSPPGIDLVWFNNGIPNRLNSQGLFSRMEYSPDSDQIERLASVDAAPLEDATTARAQSEQPTPIRSEPPIEKAKPNAAQGQIGEKFLTIEEVADKLGMSTSTVYNRMKSTLKGSYSASFPLPRKTNNQSRWLLSEVEAYMRQNPGQ